ncbi:hypothetical protein [Secundilactobacillus odoratitofui]|uniref:hypothetical protein n=1 Tax=Secundilactobacillus odoratitofui TaxID=480930 RepID=UPI002093C095|nr:hypothetical protein [Secundilactobacillus odoratitofui]
MAKHVQPMLVLLALYAALQLRCQNWVYWPSTCGQHRNNLAPISGANNETA